MEQGAADIVNEWCVARKYLVEDIYDCSGMSSGPGRAENIILSIVYSENVCHAAGPAILDSGVTAKNLAC
jgi:hypothetical protein